MSDIAKLERRIAAALERIATGIESPLPVPPPPAVVTASTALTEALEAERLANAQLTERVRAIKEKQETMLAALDRKLVRQAEALDAQGLELQRLRKTCTVLRDQNRVLTETAIAGLTDPALVNKALMQELEALRAARAAESAELDEILAELRPLVEESTHA